VFNRINFFRTIGVRLQGTIALTVTFLLIECFDELHYGVEGSALPAIRTDFGLTYGQIGLLFGLPGIVGSIIEPIIMLLGDTHLRKGLIITGGLALVLSLGGIARTSAFPVLLAAMIINYPASGAFVSLAQASLMDLNPGRQPQAMARWTVAGSLGNLIGPLMLAAGFRREWGWRWAFMLLSLIALVLTILVAVIKDKKADLPARLTPALPGLESGLKQTLLNLREAASNRLLLRWVVLLQISDLMLDVFTGYAVLYFSDVVGFNPAQTSLILAVLMATNLAANLLLIPLLERVPGRTVVRTAARVAAIIYPAWLLVPTPAIKIGLLVLLRLSTIGWYQVLQAEAYASEPDRSGTVMAITSVGSMLGGGWVWLVGWLAGQAGLQTAMWLLLAGPLGLWLFVPRTVPKYDGFQRQ